MKQYRRLTLWATLLSVLLFAGCSSGTTGVPNTGGGPVVTLTMANPAAVNTPGVLPPGLTINVPGDLQLPQQRQPVSFTANASSQSMTAVLQPNTPVAYQVHGTAGQHMFITMNGDAKYQIYGPGGQRYTGVLSVPGPSGVVLSQTGDYSIVLMGQGRTTLNIYIPPQGSDANLAAPIPASVQALTVQSGGTPASISTTLSPGTPQGYNFFASYDETVNIKTSGDVTVSLITPDQNALIPNSAPAGTWEYSLPEGGKYTLVFFGSGPVQASVAISAAPLNQPTTIPLPATKNRLTLPAGQSILTQQVNLVAGAPQAFVLSVQVGQELNVLASGNTKVDVYGPGDSILPVTHPDYTQSWTVQAYQTGDYTVVVSGSGPTTLTFYVPTSSGQ